LPKISNYISVTPPKCTIMSKLYIKKKLFNKIVDLKIYTILQFSPTVKSDVSIVKEQLRDAE